MFLSVRGHWSYTMGIAQAVVQHVEHALSIMIIAPVVILHQHFPIFTIELVQMTVQFFIISLWLMDCVSFAQLLTLAAITVRRYQLVGPAIGIKVMSISAKDATLLLQMAIIMILDTLCLVIRQLIVLPA